MKRGSLQIRNKRGQQTLGLPFSIIFSIILIVVFIVIAFVSVRYFLDIGQCASIGQFHEKFQSDIDKVWSSQESEQEYELNLPSGIEEICFVNFSLGMTNSLNYDKISLFEFEDINAVLLPIAEACDMPERKIEHLDIMEIVSSENPRCFENGEIILKKGFYDKLVYIEE